MNVITGLIKANVPARVAYPSLSTDSRTIIDVSGAERLLERGHAFRSSNTPVSDFSLLSSTTAGT